MLIFFLTLRGSPGSAAAVAATPWWCLACGPMAGADLFQNLLLFLPLGLVLGLARWRWTGSALLLLAIPIGIEVTQALLRTGRDAALGDVLANAAGGLLGWWLGAGGLTRLARWPLLAPTAVTLFLSQLTLTAFLGQPTPVGPAPWQLRLNPVSSHRPTYIGQIQEVSLGGTRLRADSLPAPASMAAAGSFGASFVWDTTGGSSLTPILRLDDARGWEIFSVDRRDRAVGMTLRTRAGALRLRNPVFRVPAGSATPGEMLSADLSFGRGEIRATISGDSSLTLVLPWGAQHGWVFINPFTPVQHSTAAWQWWTRAWLFGWGLVIAAVSWHAARRWPWMLIATVGLWLLTHLAGAGATWLDEVALALGWVLLELSRNALRRRPAAA